MKVVLSIRPSEVRKVEATGDTYEEAVESAKGMVPDGWDVISILTER